MLRLTGSPCEIIAFHLGGPPWSIHAIRYHILNIIFFLCAIRTAQRIYGCLRSIPVDVNGRTSSVAEVNRRESHTISISRALSPFHEAADIAMVLRIGGTAIPYILIFEIPES
jgi:hypothetical protein